MAVLLYHSDTSEVSPFDDAILKVARSGAVGIVSPYIGVNYLERIIGVSGEWRLISDLQEWLGSLSTRARPRAWQFIRENINSIHHCRSLHAKAVISKSLAVIGSANLTQPGILGRTELGVLLDDSTLVGELCEWFEVLWQETAPPVVDEASAYIQWLDEEASRRPIRRQRFVLSSESRMVRARLVKLGTPSQPAPAVEPPPKSPLDLSQVAQVIVVRDQKHYDSIEAALEAALDQLTAKGRFTLGDLVREIKAGFEGASTREVYFLAIRHCANHIRSVFVEETLNRLILADGRFKQSTREGLPVALEPFDRFLTALVSHLSFLRANGLPFEEDLEDETGIGGAVQIILVGELLECGLLLIEDFPGELPHYLLDREFDGWERRFKLFPLAHAAWLNKTKEKASVVPENEDDFEDDDFEDDDTGVLRYEQLPEADSEEAIDYPGLDMILRKAADEAAKNEDSKALKKKDIAIPLVTPYPKPQPAKQALIASDMRRQVDAFLARLLLAVANGERFVGPDWYVLILNLAQATQMPANTARTAMDPVERHPQVFLVRDNQGSCELTINPALKWEMLIRYPEARAACDRLLGIAL